MNHEISDRSGVFLSLLCAVHCGLTPVLLMVAPTLGTWFESSLVHDVFYVLVVGLALFTAYTHYKIHRSKQVILFFTLGIFILTYATFVLDHRQNGVLEKILMAVGGLFLILGHLRNIHLCRQSKHAQCSNHTH